jgi:hypothetical protein
VLALAFDVLGLQTIELRVRPPATKVQNERGSEAI